MKISFKIQWDKTHDQCCKNGLNAEILVNITVGNLPLLLYHL